MRFLSASCRIVLAASKHDFDEIVHSSYMSATQAKRQATEALREIIQAARKYIEAERAIIEDVKVTTVTPQISSPGKQTKSKEKTCA